MDCNYNPGHPECATDTDGGWLDGLTGFFSDIGTALAEIVDVILHLPEILLKGIGEFFGNLFGWIGDILKAIVAMPKILIDGFKELFNTLLVPSDDFWSSSIGGLQDMLESKLGTSGFSKIMDSVANVSPGTLKNITIDLNGSSHTIVDFSNLGVALPTAHMLIRGVMFYLLLKFSINCIYKLVRNDDLPGSGGD